MCLHARVGEQAPDFTCEAVLPDLNGRRFKNLCFHNISVIIVCIFWMTWAVFHAVGVFFAQKRVLKPYWTVSHCSKSTLEKAISGTPAHPQRYLAWGLPSFVSRDRDEVALRLTAELLPWYLEKVCPGKICQRSCQDFWGVFALLWAAPGPNRDRNLLGIWCPWCHRKCPGHALVSTASLSNQELLFPILSKTRLDLEAKLIVNNIASDRRLRSHTRLLPLAVSSTPCVVSTSLLTFMTEWSILLRVFTWPSRWTMGINVWDTIESQLGIKENGSFYSSIR